MIESSAIEKISQEVFELLGSEIQVEPFSKRFVQFDLTAAYDVVARLRDMRRRRDGRTVGRKIGFTNRSIWSDLGIAAPIWNYVFERTVCVAVDGHAEIALGGMPEPRIEPEVVLHLDESPVPGMTDRELFACIDWAAPAFEVVFSIFPGWTFTAADAAAAYGVHGALVVGDKLFLEEREERLRELSTFAVTLENDRGMSRHGLAQNVLGGPPEAMKFLVDEIARYPRCEPLKAGEIVTTGTLTEAMPARAGEAWTARFEAIGLAPLRVVFSK